MAEMDTSSGGGHKKGPGVKKAKKQSTRVDLTPMVDLGFLLLTFFVFTTTMSQPSAMPINEPKEDKEHPTKVKNSAATTILLGKNNEVFYYFGELTDPSSQFKSSNYKGIRDIILERKRTVSPDDIVFIVKLNDDATFKNFVDIFDEMTINAIPAGHFARAPIAETDKQLIQKAEEASGLSN
ncbi:MAG: biopolymer transporter ExbD [Ferruginibacter sp.]